MRNAVGLCVRQNRLDGLLRQLKLFRYFGYTRPVVKVVYDRVRRHAGAALHRSATKNEWVDLDQ
jgi:hypothetical protein